MNSDRSFLVNDFVINNNALVNPSAVDFFIPQQVDNRNNMADLIYPIVQEVLRTLNVDVNRLPIHPRVLAPVNHRVISRHPRGNARYQGNRSQFNHNNNNGLVIRSLNGNNVRDTRTFRNNTGFRQFRRGNRHY